MVKCPLFVKLAYSEFGLKTTTLQSHEIELFHPTLNDIKGNDPKVSQEIADDIIATGDALMINPKAYQQDGCEPSVSQVNSPLSLYNTIVVSGSLNNWAKYIKCKNFPKLINEFRIATKDLIDCEYPGVIPDDKKEETSTNSKTL